MLYPVQKSRKQLHQCARWYQAAGICDPMLQPSRKLNVLARSSMMGALLQTCVTFEYRCNQWRLRLGQQHYVGLRSKAYLKTTAPCLG